MKERCFFWGAKSPYPYGVMPKSYPTGFKNMTGLNFSAGLCVTFKREKVIFVDSRYRLAAERKLSNNFKISDYTKANVIEWVNKNVPSETEICFNENEYTFEEVNSLQNLFPKYKICGIKKPGFYLNQSISEIFLIEDIRYSEKFEKICRVFSENNADFLLLCDPLSIAWLSNIRASDDEFTPILLCRALVNRNGNMIIYSENEVENSNGISNEIEFKSIKYLESDIKNLDKIMVDFNEIPYSLRKITLKFINVKNPCLETKCIKNDIELANFRKCHLEDGIAVAKFLYWLSKTDSTSEIEVSNKIKSLRRESQNFIYESFENIIAINENSAEIHYHIEENFEKKNFQILLADTGGQYLSGTTDITRTISNHPTEKQKKFYTLVLKGHIDLFLAEFTEDTPSDVLDKIARVPLVEYGYDYPHGTGHGVGYISHVHEPLVNISSAPMKIKFKKGMILSNEPGVYFKDEFGIRIENIMEISECDNKLGFRSLTLVPYCRKLIDERLLSQEEINWLNIYHERVYNELKGYLTKEEIEWLRKETMPF